MALGAPPEVRIPVKMEVRESDPAGAKTGGERKVKVELLLLHLATVGSMSGRGTYVRHRNARMHV